MALAAAGIASTSALLADTPVTPAEAQKIKAALEAWGCTGGKMEKETEGAGYNSKARHLSIFGMRPAQIASEQQNHCSDAPASRRRSPA